MDRWKDADMGGYFPKPFKREELIFALQQVIATQFSEG